MRKIKGESGSIIKYYVVMLLVPLKKKKKTLPSWLLWPHHHAIKKWTRSFCGFSPVKKHTGPQCRRQRRHRIDPWVRKILWRRKWQPSPVFLPGKSTKHTHNALYTPNPHSLYSFSPRMLITLIPSTMSSPPSYIHISHIQWLILSFCISLGVFIHFGGYYLLH